MGKQKQGQEQGQQEQGQPSGSGHTSETGPPPQPVDVGAQVRSILQEMAKSGELLGGGESEDPGPGAPSSPPSLDLEGAVERVLSRRESQGKAEQERKALTDRLDRLENPPRKRQWTKPWSPFGG